MPGENSATQEHIYEGSSLPGKIAAGSRKEAEALRKSEEKYRNLVELTLDLIFMVNVKGRYTYVNQRFEKVTGYSVGDLIGRPFTYLVAPEVAKATVTRFKRGIRGEQMPPYEAELIHKNSKRIPVEFLVTTQYDRRGNPVGRLGIGRDITERRKADQALRQLAADLAKAQLLAHIGSWRYDVETKLSVWSEEMFRIFGLEPVLSAPSRLRHKQHIHPDDWPKYKESLRAALAGKQFAVEWRILRPDGSVRHLFTRGEAEFDQAGTIKGLFGTTQDVTERVMAEKTLKAQSEQLRILSAKLSEAQESERKRIARELHDQVGQNLTVVGINLNILRAAINEDRLTVHQNCLLDDALLLVEQTSEFTRSLMADLRPPDMDDYGLIAAIKWYAERFSMRTGLEVAVKGEDIQPRPSAYIENNLFRIVQEALTNIRKHAHATKIQIRINVAARKLRIRITDDGSGFAPEKLRAIPEYQGLGLMNMAERTDAVGGRFSIASDIGKGTEISIEVSL